MLLQFKNNVEGSVRFPQSNDSYVYIQTFDSH